MEHRDPHMEQLRQIGENLVAEFRRIAEEDASRFSALEISQMKMNQQVTTIEDRLRVLEAGPSSA